jgi:hypothetical protein
MTAPVRERIIPCPSRAALVRIVAHAMRFGRPVRRGVMGETPLALVTSDSEFADVCREVVADETPVPARFEVAR